MTPNVIHSEDAAMVNRIMAELNENQQKKPLLTRKHVYVLTTITLYLIALTAMTIRLMADTIETMPL
jgi:hypothetical protein